eukprot:TRINITY_DN11626_c0_g2_i1.p1 TRINITY_DN11626_c0_g2~~TRINITY_DN11626_c0_g2_i1.p1  ORF type:complete len:940 (+),score=205.65 TRINITY_DN11626_c0_g2_i1:104-2923(+)
MVGAASGHDPRAVAARLSEGIERPQDPDAQRDLQRWLSERAGDPEFNRCLCVVAEAAGAEAQVRSVALMTLRRSVRNGGVAPIRGAVMQTLLRILRDETNGHLPRAAGGCVAALVQAEGLAVWAGVLESLWGMAALPGPQLAALQCLHEVCEAALWELDAPQEDGATLADGFLPPMFAALAAAHDDAALRVLLRMVETLLEADTLLDPESSLNRHLVESMPLLLNTLSRIFGHHDTLRPSVLVTYKLLLVYHAEVRVVGIADVFNAAFDAARAPRDSEEELVVRACEFWAQLASIRPLVKEVARTPAMLVQLVPVLLDCLVFTERDLGDLEEEQAADDVDPSRVLFCADDSDASMTPRALFASDDEDDGDDVEGPDAGAVDSWSIRRSAALALERLSTTLLDGLLTPLGAREQWVLTLLQQRLVSADWRVQEAAVMALGAIADGCHASLLPHLSSLLPTLLRILPDDAAHHLIRAITCWTLSRFLGDLTSSEGVAAGWFDAYVRGLLHAIGSPLRKLQDRAVTAFAGVLEHGVAPVLQGGLLPAVAAHMALLLQSSPSNPRSTAAMLEACRGLAAGAGAALDIPEARGLLDALLLQMLPAADPEDPVFPAVLSAGRSCVVALKAAYAPYGAATHAKMHNLIRGYFQGCEEDGGDADWAPAQHAYLYLVTMVREAPQLDVPALLLTAPSGAGASTATLTVHAVANAHATPRPIVASCLQLLRECLAHAPQRYASLVGPHLRAVLSLLATDDQCATVACSLLHEVVCAASDGHNGCSGLSSGDVVRALVPRLAEILPARRWHAATQRRAALCLCACGLLDAEAAQGVGRWFCRAMECVAAEDEGRVKDTAYLGTVRLIAAHGYAPLRTHEGLAAFQHAVSHLHTRPDRVVLSLVSLLAAFRSSLGAEWCTAAAKLPAAFPDDIMRKVDAACAAGHLDVPPI